jgi:hypothetical protein
MICSNCHNQAHHIITDNDHEYCENCSNIPIRASSKIDGIITRNSWRIRRQQSRYEGDMVMPTRHNKVTRRQEVNPDFLKLYPQRVKDYFTPEQLIRDGYKDLPRQIEKNEKRREKQKAIDKMETFYEGDSEKAVEKFLSDTAQI